MRWQSHQGENSCDVSMVSLMACWPVLWPVFDLRVFSRMERPRLPKAVFYSELKHPTRPVFWPILRYKECLKQNLSHNALSSLVTGSLHWLTKLMELDMSWNPLKSFESQVLAHMGRLRVLSLQHCQLNAVSDIALPSTQKLDILDMSSGGIIDLGCLLVRVAVFNLTKTIIHYHKDYSKRCWKDISHVVSDQAGLCCLRFFKDKCDAGWEIERKPCQSLLLSQALLFYCCILIVLIATCNCCVFTYKVLTKSRDRILICNLALANSFIVVPLYTFIKWYVPYDIEFPFFEQFLSKSMGCRVSGAILFVSPQLATVFQMLISLQKYCGIVRRRNILSETKPLVCLVSIAAWITSVFTCTVLRFQDIDDPPPTTILKSLFYYYIYRNPTLPAFLVLDMIFVLVSVFAYTMTLKHIYETRSTQVSRKHGKVSSLSSVIRVAFIMVFSNVSVLAAIGINVWLSLATREWSHTLVLIVLIFPLQSVFNPFLFTLTIQRFIKDCRRCFSFVRETLTCSLLKTWGVPTGTYSLLQSALFSKMAFQF